MTIQTATCLVGRSQGLSADFDGSTAAVNALPTDAKLALTAGLGAYIRANPADFTAGQNSTAQSMAGLSGAPLQDAGFSMSDFGSEVLTNADNLIGKPLENIGSSFSAVLGALPALLFVAGLIIALPYIRRATAK